MRVCMVGSIFGRTAEYRRRHRFSPEEVLVDGLRERGVEVETASHFAFRPAERWDIIHVHHLAEGAIRVASSPCHAPFVFTSHDGAMLCGYERSLARRRAFAYVASRADALVALSRQEARFLDERYGLGERTAVVPNGLRPDVFKIEEAARPRARPTLLYVGQLIELKGVDVLLRALARLPPASRPDLRLVYQNAALEPQLRALANRLGIAERVQFSGFLAAEELSSIYAECDVLVLPSHAEALPSVVTEAMLCGVPVVASAVGGIPEQVGALGHLSPPGSVEGLAAAIGSALARLPLSPAERTALRARAQAGSSIAAMIDGHLRLYEQLLGARPGRRRRMQGLMDRLALSAIELYRLTHPRANVASP